MARSRHIRFKNTVRGQRASGIKKTWTKDLLSRHTVRGAADGEKLQSVCQEQKTAGDISEIIARGEAAGKSGDEILQDVKDYLDGGAAVSPESADKVWHQIGSKLSGANGGSWRQHALAEKVKEAVARAAAQKEGNGTAAANETTAANPQQWSKTEPLREEARQTANETTAATPPQWSKTEPLREEARQSADAGGSSSPSGGKSEYICVDTRVIDRCVEQKDSFIRRYDKIVSDYSEIVDRLSENWKGRGADAFIRDARVVRTNIKGIADILANMVNVLTDIRSVVSEVDRQLGANNRDPEAQG